MATLELAVGAVTDKGRAREVNEDSYSTPPATLDASTLAQKGYLFVVADGMGGHVAGATASQTATSRIIGDYYADPNPDVLASLEQAIQTANREIVAQAQDPAFSGMGTTVVAAVLRDDQLTVANVGDSRAYLIRNGLIQQLTLDHSWVAEEVRAGVLTLEEARVHPRRNVITRSLGNRPDLPVDYFDRSRLTWNGQPLALQPGDVLILCSDGLSNVVTNEEIRQLATSRDPQRAAQNLVDLANQRGGPDNITVIVAQVRRAPGAAGAVLARPAHMPALLPLAGGVLAVTMVVGLMGVVCLAAVLAGSQPPTTPGPADQIPGAPSVVASATPIPAQTGQPTSTLAPTLVKATPSPSPARPWETRPPHSPTGQYRPPQPMGPPDGEVFKGPGAQIVLRWTDEGIQGNDVFYVVVIEYPHEGSTYRDEQWTKETHLVVPAYLYDPALLTGDRRCLWHVEVRLDTGERDKDGKKTGGRRLSQPGPQRSFVWEKEGELPPPPTDIPPPTEPPTPIPETPGPPITSTPKTTASGDL